MLKDKVVVVTGGAGLLGQCFVESIVAAKGVAVIGDVNQQIGLSLKQRIQQSYDTDSIIFFPLDITSTVSINELINLLHSRYGRIDALVNNAYPKNKGYGNHFFDVTYDDFCGNINLNLGGYFLTSQQFSKYFSKQGHGNIINIASIYGVIPPRFELYEGTTMTMPVEYAVIKSGLIHLTKYMAKYFRKDNIRVNALSPGGIFDNQPESFLDGYERMSLSKGMLDKKDLCGTLNYLLSDLSNYVNGQNIIVDDGFSL
jgi:NAD(P)-dependent dehydrogenase (short-subunit alcohol dehydrogenase family)